MLCKELDCSTTDRIGHNAGGSDSGEKFDTQIE
jgi:hypothetical protein